MAGAPKGNTNAARAKKWRDAVLRALARSSGNVDAGLDKAADKLVQMAHEGDKWAIDHIADRTDGKVAQAIVGGDDDDNPIRTLNEIIIRSVDANRPPEEGN